jgi:uncharacterized repeat protein (TIGR03847 family)
MFIFDPPDRFVAGTVGRPGQRTFFLQARKAGQVVSVVLEKVQVAALAERLDALLDELESHGIAVASVPEVPTLDSEPLDEPINEAFRATTLTLGWDADVERVLVEARADPVEIEVEFETEEDDDDDVEPVAEDDEPGIAGLEASIAATIQAAFEADDDDVDGPDILRVRLTADTARSFATRAARIVASGRPPCPLCGQPLDPQGHICPRRNGHYVN